MAGRELTYSIVIKAINQATAPLRAILKGFSHLKNAGALATKALDIGSKVSMAQASVERFGQQAAAVLKKPISTFEAYDDQFKKLAGLTGDSAAQLAIYNAEAIKIGKTMGEFDPVDAVRGMNEFAIAGYKGQQILDAITPAMNLSTAAGLGLEDTVATLTGIMGGFQIEAARTGDVSDILAATFTNSKTTLASLGETLSYSGSVLNSLGIDFRDAAVMAGLLGNASIEGSRAGTAMNAIFSRLVAPEKMGRTLLQGLIGKVNDEDIKKPLELIGRLKSAMTGMPKTKQAAILKKIFGQEAFDDVMVFFQSLDGVKLSGLTSAVYGATGRVDELTKIMRSSAGNETMQMTSAISVLAQKVGEELNPALHDLKMRIIDASNEMTSFVEKHPTLTKVATVSAGAIAILASVLGVLMGVVATAAIAIGGMAKGAVAITVALAAVKYGIFALKYYIVTAVVPALSTAFIAIKGFILGTVVPLLPLIIAIAALAASAYLVYKNWAPIKQFFKQLFEDPLETVKDLAAWVGYLAGEVKKFLGVMASAPGESIVDLVTYARTALPSWAGGLTEEEALDKRSIGGSKLDVAAAQRKAATPSTTSRVDAGLKITVDQKGRVEDVAVESNNGFDMSVLHTGWAWGGS